LARIGTSPYAVLGVAEDCSREELKRAYRDLARLYHPDRNAGAEWATEKWKRVNEAYEAITKPRPAGNPSGPPATMVGRPTPKAAYVATAVAFALIASGAGFVVGKTTGADVGAARATGVTEARHDSAAVQRRAFSSAYASARKASYRSAFRATVAAADGASQ
jgi:hypothetical protein